MRTLLTALVAAALLVPGPAQAFWRHHVSWIRVDRPEFVLHSPPVRWSRGDAADFLQRVARLRAQRGL